MDTSLYEMIQKAAKNKINRKYILFLFILLSFFFAVIFLHIYIRV